MSSTPIRIRGKKRRPGEVKPQKLNKRIDSAKNTDSKPATTPKLSALERLPVEVLERIYLFALEPALPLSSHVLAAKLSSSFIKQRTYLDVFATHHRRYTSLHGIPFSTSLHDRPEGHNPERLEQSALWEPLLRTPWLSYSYMQQQLLQFVLKNAVALLTEFLSKSGLDSAAKKREIEALTERVTKYLNRYDPDVLGVSGEHLLGQYDMKDHDAGYFLCRVENSLLEDYHASEWTILTEPPLQNNEIGDPSRPCRVVHSLCLPDFTIWDPSLYVKPLYERKINPFAILSGKWTQQKGDLVCLMLQRHKIQTLYFRGDEEVVSEALLRAIEEECYPALFTIIYVYLELVNGVVFGEPDYQGKGFVVEPAEGEEHLDENGHWTFLSTIHLRPVYKEWARKNSDIAPDGPWKLLKYDATPSDSFFNRIDSPITTKHVMRSLEIAEKNGDGRLSIFRWLLSNLYPLQGLLASPVGTELLERVMKKVKCHPDGEMDRNCFYYKAYDYLKHYYYDKYAVDFYDENGR